MPSTSAISPTRTSSKRCAKGDVVLIPTGFPRVNTSNSAVIKCEMDAKRTGVKFDFSLPFEINDDNEILKRMQL